MKCYSAERKELVIQKMMLPHSIPIPLLEEGPAPEGQCRQAADESPPISIMHRALVQNIYYLLINLLP